MRTLIALCLCLVFGSALAATLKGSVYSPMAGVLCDRKGGYCADAEGVAVALTRLYLGAKAEKNLMDQIDKVGIQDFDATFFTLSDGISCNTRLKLCTVGKTGDKVDAAHTRALFGK